MTRFYADAEWVGAPAAQEAEVWLATRFTVITDGTAIPGWYWPNLTPSVTPAMRIYTTAGALVAGPIAFNSTTLGAYNAAGAGVALTAGTYDVVVNTTHYVFLAGFFASGSVTRGAITGVQGRFSTPGTPPSSGSTSTTAYGPDIDWTPTGGGGEDKTSAATHTATASLTGTSTINTTRFATSTATALLSGVSGGGATTAQEVIGMGAVYTTRERVMRAADIRASAYRNEEIDLAIESASRAIDALCRRGDDTRPGFAPWTGTITFDWPGAARGNTGDPFRLWLAPHSLTGNPTAAVSGGVTITADTYAWPAESGAPYPALAVDRSSSSILSPGSAAGQRSAAITGVWCGCIPEERGYTTWTLGASATSSAGTLTVNAPFGVGTILRIGTERLIVNDRSWSASGQTGSLTASMSDESLTVADGTAFFANEELILDAERVWVRDVVGNTLIVKRAASGSTLAAHTTAAIQWSRTALCERGALGTTAATHAQGDRVWFHKNPPLIEQLATAYALSQRADESAAYARTAGSGDSERQVSPKSVRELEDRVVARYGRQISHRAV